MDSSGEVIEEIEEETQDSEVLDVIPVQLDEGTAYEAVGLATASPLRSKYYRQTYRPAWEQMPDFKGWLRGVVGEPTRAYCTYCEKTLHAHRLSLLKHTCTIRHQKAAQIHQSKKNKSQRQQQREQHMEEIQTVVLQEHEMQDEMENDNNETIEYTEITSELDEDEHKEEPQHEIEDEEDDEGSNEMPHQIVFQKHTDPAFSSSSNQSKLPVSTLVLDATKGIPISGLQVSLYKLIDGRWTYINEGVTNLNGRFANFLDRSDFTTGRYKLHFDVDRYFEAKKQDALYPFIEIIFDCRKTTDHYHIPVILSPYGYSTYKG